MTLYILVSQDLRIIEVFSTKEKAERYMARNHFFDPTLYKIKKVELDPGK